MINPKILFFDIESAGVNALKSDLGFVIVFGYKWAHEKEAHVLTIDRKSLKNFNDCLLLKKASKLIEEADLIVGHYACVAPKTKILMADFTYKPAGDLRKGDKLLAIEENPQSGVGHRRKFVFSSVTHADTVDAPKLRITLSDGTELDCTKNHPFLVPRGKLNGANWGWVNAEDLKVGDVLTRICPTWETDEGYESGYLAAAVDGEGHLSIKPGIKVGFAQKENAMLEKFCYYAAQQGYVFSMQGAHLPVKRLALAGGIMEAFKFLGTVRPPRLLSKLSENIEKLTVSVPLENRTTIKSIRYIGVSSVVNLTTTSHTYITEGFASHNSIFDRRFIQGRLLINRLPPIPPTKMRDTCIITRSVANFSSNRLKYLAKIFNFKNQKLENNWPTAWFKVMQGDMKHLKKLADYCKGDVLALEELYNYIKPFDNPHPRIVMDRAKCGTCGEAIQYRGVAYVGVNKYRRFQCTSCGHWGRDTRRIV